MDPHGRRVAAPVVLGSLVTLAFTGILLGRSLGPGIFLYRDFVSVPNPVLSPRTWGWAGPAPRAVPLDGVIALLDPVVSSGVQQQVLLLGSLLLAGLGTTLLLRRHGAVATSVGAGLATWSPYAAERLLLGQPPTLLAWSALPWLVLAVRSRTSGWSRLVRIGLAAAPAALTPYGGLTAAVVVVGLSLLERDRRRHSGLSVQLGAISVLAASWCLPWLAPALAGRGEAGQTGGAAAFRLATDGASGVIDAFGGGGVWSSAAALTSRGQALPLVVTALVLALALLGLRRIHRPRLALTALAGPPLLGLLLATGPGVTAFAWAQQIPGVALFRDTHRLLGFSWFAVTVLAALGAAALVDQLTGYVAGGEGVRWSPHGWWRGVVPIGLTVLGVAAAPLGAPDAPSRLSAAYGPVSFPQGWACVVAAVQDHPVLVLPWQPMRRTQWARNQPFLDPLPLALPGPVTIARDLIVVRDGQAAFRVGYTDPVGADAWIAGTVDVADLRRQGLERVVEWRGTPGRLPAAHSGLVLIYEDDAFRVWSAGTIASNHTMDVQITPRLADGCE